MYNQYNYSPYQSNNLYYYVNGIDGARNFQILPNQTVLLMDNDKPMLYVKQTNQMGQATIKAFELKECKGTPTEQDIISNLDMRLKAIEERMNVQNESNNEHDAKPTNAKS